VYIYFQEFDAMLKNSIPEIQRCNLTNVVLQLLALEIDVLTFNFLDKPPKEVSGGGGAIVVRVHKMKA
jgi:ATP-dependent RNA helicase DHX33